MLSQAGIDTALAFLTSTLISTRPCRLPSLHSARRSSSAVTVTQLAQVVWRNVPPMLVLNDDLRDPSIDRAHRYAPSMGFAESASIADACVMSIIFCVSSLCGTIACARQLSSGPFGVNTCLV